jgi:two-component system chemotaxis response regulator CheY
MKILIADDDATSRAILRKICAFSPEHQVTEAADGAAAWALLDDPNRYFDVVFLDLDMPRVDGFEIVKRLGASPLHVRVQIVLCTASNDRPTLLKAIQAGVKHFIAKPCTEATVRAKLAQVSPPTDPVVARAVVGV